MRIDKLTPTIMNELINRIEIYDAQGTGRNKTQRIVIFYRFIGDFLLTGREGYGLTADHQKGSTVHYVVDATAEKAS